MSRNDTYYSTTAYPPLSSTGGDYCTCERYCCGKLKRQAGPVWINPVLPKLSDWLHPDFEPPEDLEP